MKGRFYVPSRPARGPPNLLYDGYRLFSGGRVAEAWCWPHIFGYGGTPLCLHRHDMGRPLSFLYQTAHPHLPKDRNKPELFVTHWLSSFVVLKHSTGGTLCFSLTSCFLNITVTFNAARKNISRIFSTFLCFGITVLFTDESYFTWIWCSDTKIGSEYEKVKNVHEMLWCVAETYSNSIDTQYMYSGLTLRLTDVQLRMLIVWTSWYEKVEGRLLEFQIYLSKPGGYFTYHQDEH
jgi:hypothetical protein